MSNTGKKIWLTLKKVTNDSFKLPLDVNNNLCTTSGLPQDIKINVVGDPDYIADETDLISCPVTTLGPDEPANTLVVCFCGINTESGVTMRTIVSNTIKPSGYSHALFTTTTEGSSLKGVQTNVKLIVTLPAGINKVLIGQVVNPFWYPNTPIRTYAFSPSVQAGCLVDVDGKIYAETSAAFMGLPDNVIELPSIISSEPWVTISEFACEDCRIEYNSEGEEITNTCGVYPYE